jgi:DNA-binding PadR family transcriptional regulator
LPLTPAVFHILVALAAGDRHGYAIMREVEDLSHGAVKLGPGTLYTALKRLLASRWIEAADERPDPELDDERRRYYRLTPQGLAVAVAETQRLADLIGTAASRRLLDPAPERPTAA